MDLTTILYYIGGLILIIILGKLLVLPFKILFKLFLNGIVGGIVLFLFNLIGSNFGLELAISPLNAIIVGLLGVPGVILLLIFSFLL